MRVEMKTKIFSLRFDPESYNQLEKLANSCRQTRSNYIRNLIKRSANSDLKSKYPNSKKFSDFIEIGKENKDE